MDRVISLEARGVDLRLEPPFRLGRAIINPPAHEFALGHRSQRIQPQALKVLVALHDMSERVVSRDELVDRCWDGRIVGEDVINRCISILRRVATQTGGFQIETIPRGGYRLVETSSSSRVRRHRYLFAAVAVALAVVATGLIWMLFSQSGGREPNLAVAVLPFASDKGAAVNSELAASATDSIARMLGDSGLIVTSSDGKAAAGGAPDLIVSGRIGGSEDHIIATVNVEETRQHAIILSHQLNSDREHAADLPDQVGANVAGSLSWAAPLLRLDAQHPADPAVISQTLDQFSNEEFNFWRTYEFARRYAPAAPNSAIAQWQLAMDTGMLMHGLPVQDRPAIAAALSAADRARVLDSRIGDFYIPWCLLHPQVRMLECEDRLRKALAVDAGGLGQVLPRQSDEWCGADRRSRDARRGVTCTGRICTGKDGPNDQDVRSCRG